MFGLPLLLERGGVRRFSGAGTLSPKKPHPEALRFLSLSSWRGKSQPAPSAVKNYRIKA